MEFEAGVGGLLERRKVNDRGLPARLCRNLDNLKLFINISKNPVNNTAIYPYKSHLYNSLVKKSD